MVLLLWCSKISTSKLRFRAFLEIMLIRTLSYVVRRGGCLLDRYRSLPSWCFTDVLFVSRSSVAIEPVFVLTINALFGCYIMRTALWKRRSNDVSANVIPRSYEIQRMLSGSTGWLKSAHY